MLQANTTVARSQTPLPLKVEILQLKRLHPDYQGHKPYSSFRRGYQTWPKGDLIMRLRTLCTESPENIHEVLAVFDQIEAGN